MQDRDDGAGVKGARIVKASVRRVVDDVRVVEALEGKDASDHFAAGLSLDDFVPVDDVEDEVASRREVLSLEDLYRIAEEEIDYVALTGLRLGEARALEWRNVDHEANVIRVYQSYTNGRLSSPKTYSSQRAVPMPARVAQWLRQHRLASRYSTPDDLVLCAPDSGSYFNDQALRDRFYARLTALDFKRLRLHDLRHSYCTALAAAGMPLRQLQHLAGHASYSTTEKYSHYSPDATQGMAFIERAFGQDAA